MFKSTLVLFALALSASALVLQKRDTSALIKAKFGDFKDGCFPRGSSNGCTCTAKNLDGSEATHTFNTDVECKKPIEVQTMENKAELNKEIVDKFGKMREECFPKPSGGCRCNEKDDQGNEVVKTYNNTHHCNGPVSRVKRGQGMSQDRPSQNVRDPIREKAQANYAAVINELNEKFKGLREGCYPRPKGCLCVTGKDVNGREITQRYMKDSDCKCKAGSAGCPAVAGA